MTTIIIATILTIAILVALVATLEHLDCRARERRWQKALASFEWSESRTPMTDAGAPRREFGEYGVTSCRKLASTWLNQRIAADLDNAREQKGREQ